MLQQPVPSPLRRSVTLTCDAWGGSDMMPEIGISGCSGSRCSLGERHAHLATSRTSRSDTRTASVEAPACIATTAAESGVAATGIDGDARRRMPADEGAMPVLRGGPRVLIY